MMLRLLTPCCVVVMSILLVGVSSAQQAGKKKGDKEPESPFARGEKLPGDLSDLLDADGDGTVSDEEAKEAAKDFQEQGNKKKTDNRSKAILDALDKDKDGKVNKQEAEAGVARGRMETKEGKRMTELFDSLDVDSNGVVSKREFGGLPKKLGPLGAFIKRALPSMWRGFDTNRDGQLTLVEAQMAADQFSQRRGGRDKKEDATNPQAVQIAKNTMARLDRDKDGQVSAKEARRDRVLKKKDTFVLVDTNFDDHLSYEEMVKYLNATLPKPKPKKDNRRRGFNLDDFRRGKRD